MVALILVQIIVYVAWPPPAFDGPVLPWFELLQDNRLLGLLSLDLLYLVDTALLVVMYLALYVALRRTSESAMLVGTVLGLVGVAAYYASNTAFEMLYLSNQYVAATTEAQRATFLAVPLKAALAAFRGTAFDVYYVLNDIALLVIRRRHAQEPYLQQGDRLRGARRGCADGGTVQRGDVGNVYGDRLAPALGGLFGARCPKALPTRAGRIERNRLPQRPLSGAFEWRSC
jgi:hypothetical protein